MKNILFISFLIFSKGIHARDYEKSTQKLTSLREEVENLHKEVNDIRVSYTAKVRAFSLKKTELDEKIKEEKIRKNDLLNKIKKSQKELLSNRKEKQFFGPLVLTYVQQLEEIIKKGIPFKKEQRLSGLREIKKELLKKESNPYRILTDFWSFCKEEMEFSQKNQFSKEIISVNGENRLAEVVKIGPFELFFKLEDGTLGKAVSSDKVWRFIPLRKKEEIAAVDKLFEDFNGKIKSGEFLLPIKARI
ncbi:MAG: DUF3450 family protein [Halobacteriovoraceae bacterium]|nr:DUF3450 family protein [Halobacteriovoraceae bacterium]